MKEAAPAFEGEITAAAAAYLAAAQLAGSPGVRWRAAAASYQAGAACRWLGWGTPGAGQGVAAARRLQEGAASVLGC